MKEVIFGNVLYIPELVTNLIVPNYHIKEGGSWSVSDDNKEIMIHGDNKNRGVVGTLGDVYYTFEEASFGENNNRKLNHHIKNIKNKVFKHYRINVTHAVLSVSSSIKITGNIILVGIKFNDI